MAPSVSSGTSSTNSAAAPAAAALDENWELRLVNAENPLPDNFTLKTQPISGYENRLFDARAASALENMLKDAEAAGCKLYLVSAYRSVARQDALFRRKVSSFLAEGFPAEEAEKQAAMWVARPGTSEHNLGLAADIVSAGWYKTNSDLTESFDKTPEFAWLSAHAGAYGFVLRYPKDKKEVTGVVYEPWHYRYVGNENAAMMQKTGATLEEYKAAGAGK
ncbi:MAG: M15 family metallopeptidase [Ruthenibacterium sp.]